MTISRENRLWGTERIRGELLKLGVVVSSRSVRRYRWRGLRRPPSQTWRTFLANHAHHLWAADLVSPTGKVVGVDARDLDSSPRPLIIRSDVLDRVQYVLRAIRGPNREKMVIGIRKAAAATNRDKPRVAHITEDHCSRIRPL